MFSINLNDYKKTKIYLQLFDVILKDLPINKEEFLLEHDITPSSYRLARKVEQNVGKSIIIKLSEVFKFVTLADDELEDVEEQLNKIYFDIYYKNYDNYDDHLEYINEMINKNFSIHPLFKLFKLFLLCNSNKSVKNVYSDNNGLFNEIVKYKNFYNKELVEIYNILNLFFNDSIKESEKHQDYKNPMSYQILASRCYMKEKYIEAIYYSTKACDILLDEMNFKRYVSVNRTLMACQLCIGDYETCYMNSVKVLRSVKSLNLEQFEIDAAEDYYYASLLGLKRFDIIYKKLKDNNNFNKNKFTCFLFSMFEIDQTLFSNYLKENINFKELSNEYCEYIKSICLFLEKKDKKQLDRLKDYSIMKGLIRILKNY